VEKWDNSTRRRNLRVFSFEQTHLDNARQISRLNRVERGTAALPPGLRADDACGAYSQRRNLFAVKLIVLRDRKKGGRFGETLVMFKLPAYDLFAITVMGFGILLAGIILAFAF
jgi:hypothetical protein